VAAVLFKLPLRTNVIAVAFAAKQLMPFAMK
jgi:hypothetical protein